jgi:hypothetical protein
MMIGIGDNIRSVFFLVLAFAMAPPEGWEPQWTDLGRLQISVEWSALAQITIALIGLGIGWHCCQRFAGWRSRRRRIRAAWRRDCPWVASDAASECMESAQDGVRRRHRRRRYNYYRFYLGMVRDL